MAARRGRWQRDRSKERHWRRMMRDWRRSGLSVREFCDWQALSEPSFYSWRRELAQRDRETTPRRARPAHGVTGPTAEAPRFLPVQVVTDAAQDSGASGRLEVQFP